MAVKKLKESYSTKDRINQLLFGLFKNLGVDASDDIRFDEIVDRIFKVYNDNKELKVDVDKVLSRLDKSFAQVPSQQPNQYPLPDGTRQYVAFIEDDEFDINGQGYSIDLLGPDLDYEDNDEVFIIASPNDGEYSAQKGFSFPDELDKAVDLANKLVKVISPETTEDEFVEICMKYGLIRA